MTIFSIDFSVNNPAINAPIKEPPKVVNNPNSEIDKFKLSFVSLFNEALKLLPHKI